MSVKDGKKFCTTAAAAKVKLSFQFCLGFCFLCPSSYRLFVSILLPFRKRIESNRRIDQADDRVAEAKESSVSCAIKFSSLEIV